LQDRFTVYDVFAVLIPGVVFIYLLAFTLDHAAGIQIFDWTGSVGDATLLLIFGYAAGTLLQAIGNALVERIWRRIRGGQPTATMLMSSSKKLSDSFKNEVLTALNMLYGQPSLGEKDEGYRDLLEERTYRAWKAVAPEDAQAQRFLAETHAMRAFAVAFFALTLLALVGGYFYGGEASSAGTYGTIAVAYAVLFVAASWRMENKAVTFAKHMLIAVVEEARRRREQSEQT
jgi:hypothetical protein